MISARGSTMNKTRPKSQSRNFKKPAREKIANLCCCYVKNADGRLQDPCYDSIDHCSYEVAERTNSQ